jgi:hypothetical protein
MTLAHFAPSDLILAGEFSSVKANGSKPKEVNLMFKHSNHALSEKQLAPIRLNPLCRAI